MPTRKIRPSRMLQWFLVLLMVAGIVMESAVGEEQRMLVDFAKEDPGLEMGITDDGVMGGLSKGKVARTREGTAVFSGTLSLENNGGFSSLRMTGADWNLKDWNGIVLKVRGDGRTYDLRLTTDARFRGSAVSFRAQFRTTKDEWTTVKVPFSALSAGWRGRSLDTKFEPAKVEGIGIILADKKPGPFRLEMAWVKAWR